MTTSPGRYADATASLQQASALGAFFQVQIDATGPQWRPMNELADNREVLTERIAASREVMAGSAGVEVDEIDLKAAASVVQLGLVSRLCSPALASTVLGGWVPHLGLDRLRWQPQAYNPVPVAIADVEGRRATSDSEAVEAFEALVLGPAITPLVDATEAAMAISPQVLWGNVASALTGAATMIGHARPDLVPATRRLVVAIVEGTRLAPAGEFTARGFRRSNCCLYYKVPGAGLCGDCVLQAPRTAGRH